MKFVSLKAKNFMSFGDFKLEFPEKGLYFVNGEIEGSSSSNSNGAGKSVICEALAWALYGKTIRNIGPDHIVNWSVGKNCSAEVLWQEEEKIFAVLRYRKDDKHGNDLFFWEGENDLRGSGIIETGKRIEEYLGMSWEVFSSAIIFGERAQRFTEASDADKKKIFDEILMLQQYQEAQNLVKEDILELKTRRSNIENAKNMAERLKLKDEQDLVIIEEQILSFADKKKSLKNSVEKLILECKEQEAEEILATKETERLKLEVMELQEQTKVIFQQYREKEKEKNDALLLGAKNLSIKRIKAADLDIQFRKISNWVNGVESLPKGERCPTCGRVVDDDSMAGVVAHYAEELDKIAASKEPLNKEIEEVEKKEKELRMKYDVEIREIAKTKEDLDRLLSEVSLKLNGCNKNLSLVIARLAVIDGEIKHINLICEAEEKPLLERKERLKKSKENQEKDIEIMQRQIGISNEEELYLNFWLEGFGNKGIKSFLLDEVVPLLNSKVSYFASTLLGNDVAIEFDTEAMLKSGETRDKFNIKLTVEGKVADYKQMSSGERARIDTAVLLALQNLIFSWSAKGSNVVIFDELFEHLDTTGIEHAVTLLSEEALTKAIFVVSHQPEFADYFPNLITVKKKEKFSYLEV